MAEVVDWRKVRTGKDGSLSVKLPGGGEALIGECDTFRMWMSYTNVDFQPVGSAVNFAVPTGHTIHVSLTETVIRDDLMIDAVMEAVKDGAPEFVFTGKLEGKSNLNVPRTSIRCEACIPDGEIDLLNITPGETVKRAWTFRSNADPKKL